MFRWPRRRSEFDADEERLLAEILDHRLAIRRAGARAATALIRAAAADEGSAERLAWQFQAHLAEADAETAAVDALHACAQLERLRA